jgi:hypothetical protein
MRPSETLITWFKSLDREIQETAGMLGICMMPTALTGETGTLPTDGPSIVALFEKCVRQWATGMPSHEAGAAVAVAAIIDSVLANRDGEDDWERTRRFMEHMAAHEEPSIRTHAEEQLADMPARSKIWIAAAREWRELRADKLSPATIEGWLGRQGAGL